jgi:hypothetical protein
MESSCREENHRLLVIHDFDYLNSSSCRELNALQDRWPRTVPEIKSSKLKIAENSYFAVYKQHFGLIRKMISKFTKFSSKRNNSHVFGKRIKF